MSYDEEPISENADMQVIEKISKPVDQALTKWQLSVDEILREIEQNLKGIRPIMTEEGLKYERFAEPIMSNVAISNVIREIKMRINKVSFLSDLTEQQINEITANTQSNIINYFWDNPEEIGAPAEKWNMIIDSIGDMVFIGLRKALEGGERRSLTEMEKRFERQGIPTQNKKNELFGFLNG